MSSGEELRLAGSRGQSRDLLLVANHHLLEAEVEVPGEDGVPGCSHQQLSPVTLGHCPDTPEMIRKLSLSSRCHKVGVVTDQSSVFASASDDASIF